MVVLLIFPQFQEKTFERWFSSPETQIAMFHTFFNVLCTLMFLPFTNVLVKLAMLIVPETKTEEKAEETESGAKFVYMDSTGLSVGTYLPWKMWRQTTRRLQI